MSDYFVPGNEDNKGENPGTAKVGAVIHSKVDKYYAIIANIRYVLAGATS